MPYLTASELSELVRQLRTNAGDSQRALAESTDIDQPVISKLERGEAARHLQAALTILDHYEHQADDEPRYWVEGPAVGAQPEPRVDPRGALE